MDSKPIIIAYSGSLDAFNPSRKNKAWSRVLKWFWTYKHDAVDASTRSAYFLIKAVRILKDSHGIVPSQIRFDFWGNIHPLNAKQAADEGVSEYFNFGTYMPKIESLERLGKAQMLFLPLEKSNSVEHGTLFIPGKLYEYLNTGKPVLGLCEKSDCRDILEASGLGVCLDPDNPMEIASKLLDFINHPETLKKLTPEKEYISRFDFKVKASELAKVFDSLFVN